MCLCVYIFLQHLVPVRRHTYTHTTHNFECEDDIVCEYMSLSLSRERRRRGSTRRRRSE